MEHSLWIEYPVVLFQGQAGALEKLLIEKGLITEAEFMKELSTERARFQALLRQKLS